MQQADGYLTEVAYPHHFQREATPLWLTFAATALGRHSPDITRAFDWCELGCGQGFSLVANAAANPAGHFYGLDLNPAHIGHARGLADAAGIDNALFIEADFAVLDDCQASLPEQFDFIVCHGVYSWVSARHRQALRRFVEQRLKPGGMLYLSYASQPGMAFFTAAQRFLQQYVAAAQGSLIERFEAGLDALQRLDAAGAGQFAGNREMHDYLRQSLALGTAYLAHDWLAEHWECLHVADVIADFAQAGCDYLGSATLLENIDALSIPGNVQAQLDELTTPALRETFKDLVRNQSLRRDLYQKDGLAMSADSHRRALLDQVISLLPHQPVVGEESTFESRIGPVSVDPQLLGPLRACLGQGPQSFSELARHPALHDRIASLSPALQLLAWAGQAHPLLPGRINLDHCRALNWVICERALHGEGYTHLAAPSIGSGIPAGLVEMAAARVLLEHPGLRGVSLRETVLALLKRIGWQHESAGEEQWESELRQLETMTLPIWQQMGVVGS